MDALSRYYVRKAQLSAKDEFQDHIIFSDLDALRKAHIWVFVAPAVTILGVHLLIQLQESGGLRNNFRSWTRSADTAKWDSASATYQQSEPAAEPEVAAEEKPVKSESVFVRKEGKSTRPFVRNMDPFERKKRMAAGINA